MEKTTNADRDLRDEDVADIIARLGKADFSAMAAPDLTAHTRVMVALLTKISQRHDALVKLRREVEEKTRAVARDRDAADLERVIADLHAEMKPARRPRRGWKSVLTLGILPSPR